MKTISLIFIIIFMAVASYGQDVTGQWNGALSVQGMKLRIVFNINRTETGYNSTMDSLDQGAKGIPTSSTSFQDLVLKIESTKPSFRYEGTLNKDNVITGKFSQGGQVFQLDLSRAKFEKLVRPQEPIPPYPYYSEDVKFENAVDKIELAGTLTLPKKDGVFPAVVLITGSGPQNRDEELLGHKPFLVISDFLTRNGIAVLRFDDRGTFQSKGNFGTATSFDFSNDVESAVNYLKTRKEINKQKIGLIGHSEGGMIAPMIAARSSDIDFIVLLAGPGIPGDQLLLMQGELIGRASGATEEQLQRAKKINRGAFEIVKRSTDADALKVELTKYFKQAVTDVLGPDKPPGFNADEAVKPEVNELSSPWMRYFIKYDPAINLQKVKCPVLALDGSNDLQVPPKEDLAGIKAALTNGGNKNITTIELPTLNHLFQESKTGNPDEYGRIEQTFSPVALDAILTWIRKQVK